MYSSYKIQIHPNHALFDYCDSLCFKAKNLYNITNYSSKIYKINPASFSGKPKIPKYKPKNGRTTCYLTNQITTIKDGSFLKLPGTSLLLKLGKIANSKGKLQQVRIVPSYGRFIVEVVFKEIQENEIQRSEKQRNKLVFEPKRVMGIDLGVENLATIVDNTGQKPLLIKGTWLKSINQYYNKLRAHYMCIIRNGKAPKEGSLPPNA